MSAREMYIWHQTAGKLQAIKPQDEQINGYKQQQYEYTNPQVSHSATNAIFVFHFCILKLSENAVLNSGSIVINVQSIFWHSCKKEL
jgi:hypothetical protein